MLIKDALGIGNKSLEGRERTQEAGRTREKAGSRSGAEAQAAASDRVELSGRSREMAKAHEAVAAAPEVRQQKVEELKASIANGQYEVDADQVAQKMIVNFLEEIV
jgi:negative regulator of flagellin synthesis FlgM